MVQQIKQALHAVTGTVQHADAIGNGVFDGLAQAGQLVDGIAQRGMLRQGHQGLQAAELLLKGGQGQIGGGKVLAERGLGVHARASLLSDGSNARGMTSEGGGRNWARESLGMVASNVWLGLPSAAKRGWQARGRVSRPAHWNRHTRRYPHHDPP